MFAQVVLHRRVPSKFDSFTYEVPSNLKIVPGQVVSVPFRKQKLPGIVRSLHQESPQYATKFLENASSLVLSKQQMDLAMWMSEFYMCGFSKVIDLFIPEKIWAPSKNAKTTKVEAGEILEQTVTNKKSVAVFSAKKKNENLNKFVKNLLATKNKKLILEKTPLPLNEFAAEIEQQCGPDKQVLILTPERFHLKKFGDGLPVFHGELRENKKAQVWEKVGTGEINTIIGTRAALFLPFKNLSAIIITFEHSESYKEKRTPNYNALTVAERMANLWNVPLIITSQTPRTETWHKMGEHKIEWNDAKISKTGSSTTRIVDMRDERSRGNYGIFADETVEKIARTLGQGNQVLLFINRKGEASALLCSDCGNIFKCATCNSPLTVHKEMELRCHRCKTGMPMPNICEKCSNTNLKPLGQGTEKLEKEIGKIFSRAKIIRLDSENFASRGKKSVDEKVLAEADVIIATQSIDKPFTFPRLTCSVAVSPDPLLQFPNYRAAERVFQLLTHIKNLTNSSGEFIIQTFMPSNNIFQTIQKNALSDFYDSELRTRKSLNLPPF